MTGGGADIGEATCLRLAEAGATVVAVDWNGDAISFLASDEASFVTGTNLAVDGGTAAVGKGMEWDDRFGE